VIRYHASWILPIAEPPVRDGWVAVEGGRVVAYGSHGRHRPADGAQSIDLGHVAVMPGLVNAHTHLELSYLRGEIAPGDTFVTWVRALLAARRQHADPAAPEIVDAVDRAISECVAFGTAVVADVTNSLVTFDRLARSPLAAIVFYELIRFNAPEPEEFVEAASRRLEGLVPTERVRPALAAHAPYSVAPLVFRAIRRAADRHPFEPCSVHLAESAEEVEFVRSGTGPWRALLEDLGAWDPDWVPPGGTPVAFLDDNGFLKRRVLAVHAVQATSADLGRLADQRVTVVTCPRSNRYTGAGVPPVAAFYESGVDVAIGTDSLASCPDLNVFSELAALRAIAPDVPASSLLDSATRAGARALALDADYGTIEAGKRARLLAVSLPPRVADVEEYLVSGIDPGQLRWIR
jgi:aminodeoxyfutalosine deaminase